MSQTLVAAVSATFLVSACATTPVGSLASTRPADIKVSVVDSGKRGLCPGFADQLVVRVIDSYGHSHFTREHVDGTLHWANFDIRMRGGNVGPTGRLRLIPNAERLLFKPPQLTLTPIHWPKRAKTINLPVRFDCAFRAHFSGADGRRGERGENGRAVRATLSMLNSPRGALLRVVLRTTDEGFERGGSFLLRPGRASLLISVNGGKGGRDHAPSGTAFGDGGDGGSVELHVDPMAKAHLGMVTVVSDGGAAGGPGAQAGNKGPGVTIIHKKVFEPL